MGRALATFEARFGWRHYEVAINLGNLAGLYAATGRRSLAEATYERALQAFAGSVGLQHPDAALTRYNLATVVAEGGRADEAARLLGEAMAQLRRALGAHHPDTRACVEAVARGAALSGPH